MNRIIQIFLLMLFLSSCANLQPRYGRETYYVESNGAFLPVIIEGPCTDKVIVVFHGGPGSSLVTLYYQPLFQKLLKKYRVVFWDQRCSGGCRGYQDPSTVNMAQESEDAKIVMESVKARYPRSKFYVFGISFGGLISSVFLSQHQSTVEAAIFMSPLMSLANIRRTVQQNFLGFIGQVLARSDLSRTDRLVWEEARHFYSSRPILRASDFFQHEKYATKADEINGIAMYVPFLKDNAGSFLSDPVLRVFNAKKQAGRFIKALEDNGYSDFDLTTDSTYNVGKITIPIMMQVGSMDYLVPHSESRRGYDAFNGGTPAAGSEWIMHDKVSHYLGLQLPDLGYDNYVRFIDAH